MGQRIQIVRRIEINKVGEMPFITTDVLHSHWGGYSTRHFIDLAMACGQVMNETAKIRWSFNNDDKLINEVEKAVKNTFKFSKVDEDECLLNEYFENINNLKSANEVVNNCDNNDGVIAIKIKISLKELSYNPEKVRISSVDVNTAFFEADYKDDEMVVKKVAAWDLFHKWNLLYYESEIIGATGEKEKELFEILSDNQNIYNFFEAGMTLLNVSDWAEFKE